MAAVRRKLVDQPMDDRVGDLRGAGVNPSKLTVGDAAAAKYAGLCAMSTKSRGCSGPERRVRPGRDNTMVSTSSDFMLPTRAASAAASADSVVRMPAGDQLHRHIGERCPSRPRARR